MTPVVLKPAASRAALALAITASLAACSSVETTDDTLSYRTVARKTRPLEAPPDLSALVADGRYQPQAGAVSASSLGQPGRAPAAQAAASTPANVALTQEGDVRLVRDGQLRWLSSPRAPEVLWPLAHQFWEDLGFGFEQEDASTGLLLTDWRENRAKLPQDGLRRAVGRVFERLYATGERDQFRMRMERTPQGGTEIYIAHRGVQEVYESGPQQGSTTWAHRPTDPMLEAEVLSRLMVALGGNPRRTETAAPAPAAASAPAIVASASSVATAPARARVLTGEAAATMQLDDPLERAWRRVGLALDRAGFTVEERDRGQGLYTVRYVDPVEASREQPGFWARLFGAQDPLKAALGRYRVKLVTDGANAARVSVQTLQGAPDNSASAQRIIQLLVDDLKL